MLNLDQVLILSDIFAEMKIENMPLGLSIADKEKMQAELRKAYLIKNREDQEASVKAIQSKYGSDIIPLVIKFVAANLGKAKGSIKEFIASYKEITVEEASKLGVKEIVKIISEIKDEIKENVQSFLSQK